MKSKDIHVGESYSAKVSGHLAIVRIDSVSPYGGWDATNETSGRSVRIKSPQRLRFNQTIARLILKDGDLRNMPRGLQSGDEPSIQRALGLVVMQEAAQQDRNPGEPVYH